MKEFIVNFVPTGMVPTKKDSPYIPISIEEIYNDVKNNLNNITIVHLHARDNTGLPSIDSGIWEELLAAIRSISEELIICVSLSGRNVQDIQKRIIPLQRKIKPDMGSLTLSSLNFAKQASINSPETIQYLAHCMIENGIMPELEVFDLGMINYAKYLISKKILQEYNYYNIILGNIAGAQIESGTDLLKEIPNNNIRVLGGIGNQQHRANLMGIIFGDGVRVGLEDNLMLNGKLATNTELINNLKVIISRSGMTIMKPSKFREIINDRKT